MSAAVPFWLIALPLLALAAGLALLLRGWVGDVVGNHPFCRRCGFDLYGLPGGAAVCSECGTTLSGKRSIRTGTRRRRRGWVMLALALLVPALAVLGALGWRAANNIQWIRYEPFWYVLRQTHSTVGGDRKDAVAELLRRVQAKHISDARLSKLVDEMLAAQADLSLSWDEQRGDLIEAARAQGKLSAEKWKQYLRNVPQFTLVARPNVRRGDDLPIQLSSGSPRCGTKMQLHVKPQLIVPPGGLVTPPEPLNVPWFATLHMNGGLIWNCQLKVDAAKLRDAADGPQPLTVRWNLDVWDADQPLNDRPTTTYEAPLQTTWNLVPAGATTLTAVPDDPATHAAMQKGIRIRRAYLEDGDPNEVYIYVDASGLPVPLAHRIFLRSGTREWEMPTLTGNSGFSTSAHAEHFDIDTVDVVFRPDEAAARRTVNLSRYWNGELTIHDVHVRRPTTGPGPSTNPAP